MKPLIRECVRGEPEKNLPFMVNTKSSLIFLPTIREFMKSPIG